MVSSSIVEYIKKYSSQYSKESLRSYLIEQGYSTSDVDQAFSVAIGKNKLNLKTFAIVLGIIIVFLLIVYVSIGFISRNELKFNLLVSVNTEFERETSQAITITTYSTSEESINGLINVNIFDPQNKEIFSKEFFVSFDKEENFDVELSLGKNSLLGRYKTKVSLTVEEKKLEKEVSFVVKEKSPDRPRQTVTPISTSKCPISCDDLDPCSTDACVNGLCSSMKKSPCCGNNNCEDSLGETVLNCPNDCRAQKTKTVFEIKQDAILLASSNPDLAATTCLQLSNPDSCIFELYESTRNQDFCRAIVDISFQSNCYLDYALRKKDFSVCNSIREEYSQRNCFSMKQLGEMNVGNGQ
ncbi:MAG: hypothetical protein AABX39_02410 [Nanoarchaeota archaeon]